MNQIEELSKIPWKTLDVASGKGAHIPGALLGLISQDEAVRYGSYWQLDNEVVCQSDLYEAAYFVVPFLLTMLRERVPHGRERIYNLLYEIANGDAPATVVILTDAQTPAPLKEACFERVLSGSNIYSRDASDPDQQIRKGARDLLDLLQDEE